MSADSKPHLPAAAPEAHSEVGQRWLTHLALFALTVLSVFHHGALMALADETPSFHLDGFLRPSFLAHGASYAVPLMAILLTHEFGHFFTARVHRVAASLPYFLPLPVAGWGTLGAVIAMRGEIRTRRAVFDIGASGPIAGLCVAIPVLMWGLAHSQVEPLPLTGYDQEGQSLLYLLLKRIVLGPIPDGYDVILHPTAMAGWFGLLMTMINLVPFGQLDGGHIAYALFGERQYRYGRWLRSGLLLLVGYNLVRFVLPVLLGHSRIDLLTAVVNSLFWLIWFAVLGFISRASGGPDHPPCEPGELDWPRRVLAWGCLLLFVLLFMPTPMAHY
jgi:membrane-associated protease RseP (regulator of RpoE activity)